METLRLQLQTFTHSRRQMGKVKEVRKYVIRVFIVGLSHQRTNSAETRWFFSGREEGQVAKISGKFV